MCREFLVPRDIRERDTRLAALLPHPAVAPIALPAGQSALAELQDIDGLCERTKRCRNIRAQVEGAALWGLSLALHEKATLKDGGIGQTDFDTYTPLRMSQLPDVAISVIATGEKATGVGEPAVTVIAPALANAISNVCGARPKSLNFYGLRYTSIHNAP